MARKPKKNSAGRKLTIKQEQFCVEYVVDFDGSKAAIRAGYSKSTSRKIAWNLLQDSRIQARIAELAAEKRDRAKITADEVINAAARVMDQCMDAVPVRDRKGEIVEGEWTFQAGGANGAIANLSRMLNIGNDINIGVSDESRVLIRLVLSAVRNHTDDETYTKIIDDVKDQGDA